LAYKSNNNFLTEEILIILFLIVILIGSFHQELLSLKNNLDKIINPVILLLTNNLFWTIVFGSIIIFLLYQIYSIINNKIRDIKEEKQRIKNEAKYINNFLKEDIHKLTKEQINNLIEEAKAKLFHEKTLKYYKEEIRNNLAKARKLLIELEHKENLKELKREKNSIEGEVNMLKERQRLLSMSKEERENETFRELEDNFHRIFEKSKLSKNEIKVLLKKGYSFANEYCVKEKRVVSVLVKPFLNHTKTHAFLMWSVRRLLDEYEQIDHIRESLTKERVASFYYFHNSS